MNFFHIISKTLLLSSILSCQQCDITHCTFIHPIIKIGECAIGVYAFITGYNLIKGNPYLSHSIEDSKISCKENTNIECDIEIMRIYAHTVFWTALWIGSVPLIDHHNGMPLSICKIFATIGLLFMYIGLKYRIDTISPKPKVSPKPKEEDNKGTEGKLQFDENIPPLTQFDNPDQIKIVHTDGTSIAQNLLPANS